MKLLRLSQIKCDHTLTPRIEKGVSPEVVEDYAACFAQLPPIVVFKTPDEKDFLLADGWHRYRAAEKLKLEEVEADVKYGTRAEAKEYALLCNLKHGRPLTRKERQFVIAEFLKLHPERANAWIADDLGVNHETVEAIRDKLEAGCEIRTLAELLGKDGKTYPRSIEQPKQAATETQQAPLLPEAVEPSEMKPLIVESPPSPPALGTYLLNQVYNVDCIQGMAGLPESSVDLVFADPPYNLGKRYGDAIDDKLPSDDYYTWCMQWFLEVRRVLKPGGAFYLMHYPEVAAIWKQRLDMLLTFRRWLTWVYPANVGHSDNNWSRAQRSILYYVKGSSPSFFDGEADPQPYKNPDDARIKQLGKRGTVPYDWWEYNLVKNVSADKTDWPNQIPTALVKRIILASCPKDGILLDPFMGSGTTAIAAIEGERQWLGFDIAAKACQITKERITDVTGNP